MKKKIEQIFYYLQTIIDRGVDNEKLFGRIYSYGLWGTNSTFDSGTGSGIGGEVYSTFIHRLTTEFEKPVTVLDLGCGDFRIGEQLVNENVNYIGIDVVHKLIKHNRKLYQKENISFYQADIINDNLPNADICLIRQVLQHLPNEDIKKILAKIKKYPIALISEHHTEGIPNRDKVTGFGIRDGGIHLDKPPFNENAKKVLEIPHGDWGYIITYLIEGEHGSNKMVFCAEHNTRNYKRYRTTKAILET